MKIDHLVLNVDKKYQNDLTMIEKIRKSGILYEPKFGKGTKGFKATNVWFGVEYFEMICILQNDGGGWIPEWAKKYNEGHRGGICLFLDVEDINKIYETLTNKGIDITKPEWLKFKWFFNLFTRTMPWMNSYIQFFEGVPLQLGFQQMKDKKSRDLMNQYMYPNSKDNGIEGIKTIQIEGAFTENDFKLIKDIFENTETLNDSIETTLTNNQKLIFKKSTNYNIKVYTNCTSEEHKGNTATFENVEVIM